MNLGCLSEYLPIRWLRVESCSHVADSPVGFVYIWLLRYLEISCGLPRPDSDLTTLRATSIGYCYLLLVNLNGWIAAVDFCFKPCDCSFFDFKTVVRTRFLFVPHSFKCFRFLTIWYLFLLDLRMYVTNGKRKSQVNRWGSVSICFVQN